MIPLFAPFRQNEAFTAAFLEETRSLLASGQYILGTKVTEFESALAETTGYQYAEACSSGTEALILALRALQLPPGSDVLTPAFSFVASANVIALSGNRPVFSDVDADTGCVTVEHLEAARTPNTKAVIAVDLYGRQVAVKEIRAWCLEHGLKLIEDGAQSIGVPNQGADFFTTSFYPTKNIGAIGDAGAIMTDDAELASRVRQLVRQGEILRDHYEVIGTNGRMDTLQAAILLHKLPHMHEWSQARTELAKKYLEAIPLDAQACAPKMDDTPNVWSLFCLRTRAEDRSGVIEKLRERGVGSGVYYSRPLNTQPSMRAFDPRACPNAEKLATEVIAIPIYPELSESEVATIVLVLRECLNPAST